MTFLFSDKNPAMPVAYSSVDAMHTKMEIVIAGIEKDNARRIVESLWSIAKEEEAVMNRFSLDSEIHMINMTAFGDDIAVSDKMFMVLKMCQVFKSATKGFFDITANASGRDCSGADFLLDEKKHTIRFPKEGTRLDLGGFAKGYTLDRMVKVLRNEEIKYGLVNLGDSSRYAVGTHPFGEWWPIGLEHPYFKGRTMHQFKLKDCALSISGKNRQGKAHIVDPVSGSYVNKEELIAVRGVSPLVAEVLSTAIYVAPEQIRGEIAAEFPDYTIEKITPLCNGESTIFKIDGKADGQ